MFPRPSASVVVLVVLIVTGSITAVLDGARPAAPILSIRPSPAPLNPPSGTPSPTPIATATPTASASPSPATTPTPIACSNLTELATWNDSRLAMLTIAVPVSESGPGAALAEVQAGAGGLLLFGSAAPSNLGSMLASVKVQVPGQIGLLVMTDEEGGGIQRMANLAGSLPWPAWMGANWSPGQIQNAVAAVGRNMLANGVNMDLAPVIDVDGSNVPPSGSNADGWRSFSGNTTVVSRDGVAFMNGLKSSGVIPVMKHFPGLGGSSGNTDLVLAHTLPWPTLQQVAIPPFAAAINAGAPAIMVSNASVPGLTNLPASLSPAVMHQLEVLNFHGLVMTDSLSAVAISAAGYSMPAAAVQAIRAGADMVMFGLPASTSETISQTFAIRSAIVSAVTDGSLNRSRLIDADAAVLASRNVNLCG